MMEYIPSEFYSTSEMLKDVPHLKGQLEIMDGNVNVNNVLLEDQVKH